MTLKAIVVDDEPLARSRLKRLLINENLQIVGEGENGAQAVELVRELPVDILFIDINMPIKDGIQAVLEISDAHARPPAVVFCTAYDEYAIQAFKTNATAYLLKPVTAPDLRAAIAKAQSVNRVQVNTIADQSTDTGFIVLKNGATTEKTPVSAFVSFRSANKNVYGKFLGGSEIVVDFTLKELEALFSAELVRAHRSVLINRTHVVKLIKDQQNQTVVVASDQSEFSVSRRHLSEVKKCFK